MIVAYDTRRNPLRAIEAAFPAVDHLIVVDNAPDGHVDLRDRPSDASVTIVANRNTGGLAGAYNAALAIVRRERPATTHILFLDDDTDLSAVSSFLAHADTRRFGAEAQTAAVAPAYVDRATGLRGAHVQLARFRYRFVAREVAEPTAVSFLINSMSLWRLAAIQRIGTYDIGLGVDHVDTDYCLRAALLGYRLVLNPQVSFVHSIGDRRTYRFLGKTLQAGGHGAARRRMIARNTIVLARRYALRRPAFVVLCLTRIAYESLGIAMAESDRCRKLWAVLCGAASGMVARRGN